MRRKLIVAAVAVLALTVAGVALAATQIKYSSKFTTKELDHSTGVAFRLTLSDPTAPDKRPATVSRVIIKYNRGTTSNTHAAPQCNVSNSDLMKSSARKLCPARSRYGKGYVIVRGPTGGDVKSDLFVYNRRRAAIFEFEIGGTVVAGFNARFVGRTLDTGNLAGALPGDLRVTKLVLNLNARSRRFHGHRVNMLTTPGKCPPTHRWITRTEVRLGDGTKQVKRAPTRCRP